MVGQHVGASICGSLLFKVCLIIGFQERNGRTENQLEQYELASSPGIMGLYHLDKLVVLSAHFMKHWVARILTSILGVFFCEKNNLKDLQFGHVGSRSCSKNRSHVGTGVAWESILSGQTAKVYIF